MTTFDFYRLLHQARFNTRVIMGRYRVWFVDGLEPMTHSELLAYRRGDDMFGAPESELRAMWGDR